MTGEFKKVYRGVKEKGISNSSSLDRLWKAFDGKTVISPVWFTPDIEFAKLYAGHHGEVLEAHLEPVKTFPLFPLRTKLGNYVEPTEYGQSLINDMLSQGMFGLSPEDEYDAEEILKSIDRLDYDVLETSDFISWLVSNGYDSFLVRGDGPTNIAVLDKNIIKDVKPLKQFQESSNVNNLVSYLFEENKVSKEEALEVGKELGLNWDKVSFDQFLDGMNVELEHGSKLGKETNVTKDDLVATGKIALAHLEEIPDYYSRLQKMEKDSLKEFIFLTVKDLLEEAEYQGRK